MRRARGLAAIAAVALLLFSRAEAAEPVAIVEEASSDAPVRVFSYLSQGQVIRLGATAKLLIGYLHSCVQERVQGGVVTIGRERSQVVGGHRAARVLDCGGAAELSRSKAERGAVLVMRKPTPPEPQLVLASVSPLIAPRRATLSVRLNRLDRSEPPATLMLRNGVVDLAASGRALARGGIYRVEAGAASMVFKVAADAQAGGESVLLRLLSF